MRCPNCGGISNHHVTGLDGNSIYLCTRPIHHLRVRVVKEQGVKRVEFYSVSSICNTYIDHRGKVFSGYVPYIKYVTNDKGREVPEVITSKLGG
jgi:hypothetical protein